MILLKTQINMKIFFTTMALMMSAFALLAQSNAIIYTDFQPDSLMIVSAYNNQMLIDFNGDHNPDIKMYSNISSTGIYPYIASIHQGEFELSCPVTNENIGDNSDWRDFINFDIVRVNTKYGFRFSIGQDYLYGWFETCRKEEDEHILWGCVRCAYCTIPNHPILWGQTQMNSTEEEHDSNNVSLHPNPATGMVTLTGEGIREVEINNLLGQRVAGVEGHDAESLTLSLEGLPQGVYLVSVRLADGKRCEKKLVVQQ